MADIENKRNELIQMMMDALAVTTDEAEGRQAASIEDIHGCNTDYIDYDDPLLTPAEINAMLHLDENNLLRNPEASGQNEIPLSSDKMPSTGGGTAQPSEGGGVAESPYPQDNPDNAPGTGAPGLSGDREKAPAAFNEDGTPKEEVPSATYGDIKIPDDVALDDIVDRIINDDSVGPTRAVIEFAQPSIRDSRGVDFNILVKPGDAIDENTILATVTVDGKKRDVRSIFGEGTVVATPDGRDYKRLYRGYGADRHFIIENYVISGGAPEITTEALEEIQKGFKEEACFYDLITNNLCESVLPWILLRRHIALIPLVPRPNGRRIFKNYMEYVNEMREDYQRDMRRLGSEESIEATGGNVRKINELGNRILARRREYAEDIIRAYRDYKKTLDWCEFDPLFSDCKHLAYMQTIGLGFMSTSTKIGDEDYWNYYMCLLSMLDTSQDNEYVDEYRELIAGIITERMSFEGYSINVIKQEFDKMFKNVIRKMSSPFNRLNDAMNEVEGGPGVSDAAAWIGQQVKNQDDYTEYAVRQLANIYMFIRDFNSGNLGRSTNKTTQSVSDASRRPARGSDTSEDKPSSILDLVRKENSKLEAFWEDKIARFLNTSIQDCIDKIPEFIEKVNVYAEWPQPSPLTYGNDTYDHYLFVNSSPVRQQPDGDVDYGTNPKSDLPKTPETVTPPQVTLDDLKLGPDNIQENEISIKDFSYWQKYFGLATIISIPFMNCGLDIPPAEIMMIPLPCIFIALACTYIKTLDLVLVVGLSIRGMYVWPVFLYVNCSQQPLSILTPLIAQVKTIKSKISAKINGIAELSVNSIADGFIKTFEDDSRELRRQNKQLETYISQIQMRKTDNQEAIRRHMDKLFKPDAKTTQQVIDPLGSD